jgi:hypothetical protein
MSLYWKLLMVAAVTCSLAGCSGKVGPVCYPVRGQVSYKGKPLAEAMVVMHRLGGDVEGKQKPMAYTSANGEFAVTTLQPGDGAPPGDYAVTVELRAVQTGGEEPVRNGPNVLPAKYAKPANSNIKFAVKEGENQIPAINIM